MSSTSGEPNPSKFPPPPKWGTWQPKWRGNGMAKFRTHSRLVFAKRSLTDMGRGNLYEWSGREWVLRAVYPNHTDVEQLFVFTAPAVCQVDTSQPR